MPARRLPALLVVCLAAATALGACDFAGADTASGTWTGAATFQADTILADYNVRLTADYQTTFTFRLTDDGGLITGVVEAHTTGYRTVQEAGHEAGTYHFDDEPAAVHDVFGTFVEPTLEVDVPGGPYEANLWTFEVSGRRAALAAHLVHTLTIRLADGFEFPFDLLSEETFEMERVADAE